MLASSGTALERLLLCGKHYDIMQVDLIDLMEHADMVFKPSCDEKQPVFRRSEPHLKEMKGYINVELLQKHVKF